MTNWIYLAGPIAGCTDEEANDWRSQIRAGLADQDIVILDPMDRDFRGVPMTPQIASDIVTGDKSEIDTCDIAVFNCWKPGWGTAMEMLYAYDIACAYVVAIVPTDVSLSPWIIEHSYRVVYDVKDAVAAIIKLCST